MYFVESVLTFSFLCWYGGLSIKNKKILGKVVSICGKVVGERMNSLDGLYRDRSLAKAQCILKDTTHVLAHHFERLPLGRRFRTPLAKSNRHRNSFIPSAIRFLNK